MALERIERPMILNACMTYIFCMYMLVCCVYSFRLFILAALLQKKEHLYFIY